MVYPIFVCRKNWGLSFKNDITGKTTLSANISLKKVNWTRRGSFRRVQRERQYFGCSKLLTLTVYYQYDIPRQTRWSAKS
jgi:hypothetical protein